MSSSSSIIEAYGWSVTWCRAFPTLLELYCEDDDLDWRLRPLAWRQIYPLSATATVESNDNDDDNVDVDDCWQDSLGYGEILPETVFTVVNWLKDNVYNINIIEQQQQQQQQQSVPPVSTTTTTTIFDLGSGDGKVIMAAALCFPSTTTTTTTTTLIGMEIVPQLHHKAIRRLQQWNEMAIEQQQQSSCSCCQTNVEFHLNDFTTQRQRIEQEADLVWIHATVFEDELFSIVQDICESCRPGTIFVLISRPLLMKNDNKIETLLTRRMKMSWGDGMVHVQRRRK